MEIKMLLVPLIDNDADVVLGSRFLSSGVHRVLYFWYYLGNCFLTFYFVYIYWWIGGDCKSTFFLTILSAGLSLTVAALMALLIAATVNDFLCIFFLFRHKARWTSTKELNFFVVSLIGVFDLEITKLLIKMCISPGSPSFWQLL